MHFLLLRSNVPYPKTKLQVSTVAEMETDGIKGAGSVTLDKLLLMPQTMFTSNKRFCNVIQVSYELIVEAEVSGCRGGIEIRIPITVGLEYFEADARTFSVNNGISSVMNSTPVATSHGLRKLKIDLKALNFRKKIIRLMFCFQRLILFTNHFIRLLKRDGHEGLNYN